MIENLQIIKENIEYILERTSINDPLLKNFLVIQDTCNKLIEEDEWNNWNN